jgi:hypothetical protein
VNRLTRSGHYFFNGYFLNSAHAGRWYLSFTVRIPRGRYMIREENCVYQTVFDLHIGWPR